MTAIKPSDSVLRDQIDADGYNSTLNDINVKYTEMDKYIGNLESDVMSIKDFEKDVLSDLARGYDVGTSLDTLGFQKDSLQIDLDFFKHMKDVYIKKLYGDLYKYCDSIIESALAIEEIPTNSTRDKVKERKFRNMTPYPPNMVPNPSATDSEGNEISDVPKEIIDPFVKYDMNEIFALINCTTSNLRELAEDIGSFEDKINRAKEREKRGFNVGNLIMNLEGQKQKLTLEFTSYISRLSKFLEQNKNFSGRCLNRIKLISSEIVTAEEAAEQTAEQPTDTVIDDTT
uniref:Uncharacterized protein n=1 Tax=Megaviridae environmental sample TaxID=1737588 RepID=A0A5J6VKY6_9VIRU|nr:MAG: hypothetical protein [Megaviridae environmental sample]